METVTIENRTDLAQWAIERAKSIVAEEGGNLCLAARDQGDEQIAVAANALGQVIVDALLEVFDGLERDGADWRMTMSVTPTLAAMLADPLLQYRYVRHFDNLIALAGKEIERTRWQPEFHHLAHMYHNRFLRAREVFVNQYGNNLLHGFKRFFESAFAELSVLSYAELPSRIEVQSAGTVELPSAS